MKSLKEFAKEHFPKELDKPFTRGQLNYLSDLEKCTLGKAHMGYSLNRGQGTTTYLIIALIWSSYYGKGFMWNLFIDDCRTKDDMKCHLKCMDEMIHYSSLVESLFKREIPKLDMLWAFKKAMDVKGGSQ